MRCTLLKITASFAKSLFRFHLKKPFVTHCLVMLYLNKQRFVPNIDFSLTERHTVQKHICWRLFAVLPDTKRLFRQHATKRHMQKHICAALLFCSKFALRNCDWRKFRLRVQVFDTKKQFAHGFRGVVKILLRRLFASAFIWKSIFVLTFAMRFQIIAQQVKCQFYRYRRPAFTALASSLPTASITVAYVFSTTGELEKS